MRKKRTEVTIEVEEVIYAAGYHSRFTRAWCVACGAEAVMVTPEQAALIAGVSLRAINRWIKAGRIHFIETRDGRLRVCVTRCLDLQT